MRSFVFCFLLGVLLTGLACSQTSPVTPSSKLCPQAVDDSSANGRVLWGIWDVRIDADSMSAEIVPLRGPAFTCNVTRFMQPPVSPVNMISITLGSGSAPANGYFEAIVTLKHPFPGMNQYNGFDVRGIFMSDGTVSGEHDSTVLRAGPADSRLLNADGYTRWWNYPEFTSYNTIFGFTSGKLAPPNHPTATVNPYKYFADGLDKDSPCTAIDFSKRGFFATMPGSNTRQYNIQFKMNSGSPVFDFQYAVDASWDLPDPAGAPGYPPEYFSLSANCQEAFAISVSDEGSTAFWLGPGEYGGELKLSVEVFDWQSLDNPGGVQDEVSAIWVEGPIFPAPVDILPSATVLPGSSDVSSVFQTVIGTLDLTESGEEEIFVTVESKNPSTYEPQVAGGGSFSYPSAPLAAFFLGSVTILSEAPGKPATVLSIDPNWGWKGEVLSGVTIGGKDFDPAASVELEYAPGNVISGTNVQWVSSTTLKADFDLSGATVGFYDVKVTNPFFPAGVLEDGFEVKEFKAIWPVTQGNPQHTGHIGFNGPTGNASNPKWNVTYPDCNKGNALPVFLNDTTAFFTIAYNYLDTNHLPAVAVDLASHSIKWTKVINTTSHSSLNVFGVSADGSVVLVQDWPTSNLYGLKAEDGSILWGPVTGGPMSADAYPALDKDGNFIMPAGSGLKSINPKTGAVNWTWTAGGLAYCTPAVGTDGTIYCYTGGATSYAYLHAVNPATGADKWSSFPTVGYCHNGVVYNPVNETILLFGQNGLYCFKDNGSSCSVVWVQSYPYPWYSSTSVAPNGDVYLVDGSGTLRRLNPSTGATINSSSGWGSGYGSRPAIGENGILYINSEGYMRCFNADCTQKWAFYGSNLSYWGAPAIGQDGTVYSARRDNGLCAWHD